MPSLVTENAVNNSTDTSTALPSNSTLIVQNSTTMVSNQTILAANSTSTVSAATTSSIGGKNNTLDKA